MSNIKEVANINGYRIKDSVSREKINKTPLADFVDFDVFAQIIGEKVGFDMSGCGVQSFAIGNDVVCVGISHTEPGTGNQSKLITYNINTGDVIAFADNLSIGHCNGMTYCDKDGYFYIACGGGKNGLPKVEVYDSNLKNIKTIFFSDKGIADPFGIAWHKKTQTFYCCVNTFEFIKFNYEFDIIEKYPMGGNSDTDKTTQTIFVTDDYLCMIYNNLANKRGNYNKIDVYHIDTMKYYKKQYVMGGLELEHCCYYNENLYLLFNSQNSGLICKGSLFDDEFTGNYIPKYLFGGSKISTSALNDEYYVDSTYKEFFVENTEEKPFNKLLVVMASIIKPTYKEIIKINLKGDFSDKPINIKHLPCSLSIEGYGNTKTKIGGIYIQNVGVCSLKNISVVDKSPVYNRLISLKSVQYAWLDGVDFDGKGTEQDALWLVTTTANIKNSNFNSDVTRNLIHCSENSYIMFDTASTFNGKGGFLIPENCKLPEHFSIETANTNFNTDITFITQTLNFDITSITRSGKYQLESGSTSINVPTPLTSGGYVFTVTHINTLTIYEVIQYNKNKYIGVYAGNDGNIKWLGNFYVSKQLTYENTVKSGNLYFSTTDLKTVDIMGGLSVNGSIASGVKLGVLDSPYFPARNIHYYIPGVTKSGRVYLVDFYNNELFAYTTISNETEKIEFTGRMTLGDLVFTI